jgi:hypothetical protein
MLQVGAKGIEEEEESYTQSIGLLGRGISQSQSLYLQEEQHTHTE